jgi:hypothetical protein
MLLLLGSPLAQEVKADGFTLEMSSPIIWDAPAVTTYQDKLTGLVVRMGVPKGFRVYGDQVLVTVGENEGLVLGAAELPVGVREVEDERATEGRAWYDRPIDIAIPIAEASVGLHRVSLSLTAQGCRDGICYPPTTTTREVYVHVHPGDGPAAPR